MESFVMCSNFLDAEPPKYPSALCPSSCSLSCRPSFLLLRSLSPLPSLLPHFAYSPSTSILHAPQNRFVNMATNSGASEPDLQIQSSPPDGEHGYPHGHLGHLSDNETEALDTFKKLVEEEGIYTPGPPPSHDDTVLLYAYLMVALLRALLHVGACNPNILLENNIC